MSVVFFYPLLSSKMKNRQKIWLTAATLWTGLLFGNHEVKVQQHISKQNTTIDSLNTVLAEKDWAMMNHLSMDWTMDWKVAQFLSAKKETGIPQAMIDLLASDERFGLEIHEGSELPSFIQWKVHSYANQEHALLILKGTWTANKNNPEDIKVFVDFTRWPWWPFPAKVIVWSTYKQRLQTPQIFTLTDNNKLLSAGGKTVDLKDVINTGYVEYSADYIE